MVRQYYSSMLIILITACLVPTVSIAVGTTTWEKTFDKGYGYSVQQTADGGYIIGWRSGLIKTDGDGNELWNKTLGDDSCQSMDQTNDGGYIIGIDDRGYRLIKTDGFGNEQWSKTLDINPLSVKHTTDNGYIILGLSGDAILIKTDSSGNEQWRKTFGTGGASSVQQTTDGGYIVTADKREYLGYNEGWLSHIRLIRVDTNGNELWEKTFGGSLPSSGVSYQVQQTTEGGYVVLGNHGGSYRGELCTVNSTILLIKTDANGNELLNKTLCSGFGISMQQTTDGGYIIAGEMQYYKKDYYSNSVVIIKTDSNGIELWNKAINESETPCCGSSSPGCYRAVPYFIQQTADGGYVVAGRAYLSNKANWEDSGDYVWLVKTDANGNM